MGRCVDGTCGKFGFWLLAFSLASDVSAQTSTPAPDLTDEGLFARCYAHFTDERVPLNHPLRLDVIAKRRTPVDACMLLFGSADLNGPGSGEGVIKNNTPEGLRVLRVLTDFHRGWFNSDSFAGAINLFDGSNNRQRDIMDEQEGGYHVTRALLTPGVNYSEVVTSPAIVEALRASGPLAVAAGMMHAASPGNSSQVPLSVAEGPQSGVLQGVRRVTASLNPTKWNQSINVDDNTVLLGAPVGRLNPSQPVFFYRPLDPAGGGVLTSPAYYILNQGLTTKNPSDGGVRVQRRLAATFFKEMMCREVPVVRKTDAALFTLSPSLAGPNTPAFRTNRTCMQCHASIDPAAYVVRNQNLFHVARGAANDGHSIQVYSWAPSQPAQPGWVDTDVQFFRRPPDGRFYFRSYDGRLNSVGVRGIAQFGQAVASTDDYYVCAAAKYFEFFTGIRVSLQDIGDPDNSPLNSAETYYRDEVIKLGLDFKTNGNGELRNLVRQILSHPLYRQSSMR